VSAPIINGCEPLSVDGTATGVLVLHGFTGCPFSVSGIADRMANAGFSVEAPLLPGHGTSVDDMLSTRFDDWSAAAEESFRLLSARTERVFVAGLSMGGTLACWLAEHHPEIAGLVLVNPFVEPVGAELPEALAGLVEAGTTTMDAIGSDIAREGAEERSYPVTPIEPLLSLFAGVEGVSVDLGRISCPVLLFSSVEDHVVPPSNGPHLIASVAGSVEQVALERSYHVATLDYDAPLIEVEAVAFVERITEQGA
jgi:carboxylesterase